MSTAIEEERTTVEELDRLEQAVADRLSTSLSTVRDVLERDHEIAQLIERCGKQAQHLKELLEFRTHTQDRDALGLSKGDTLVEFYSQQKDVKEFHRRHPNEPVEDLERVYRVRNYHEGELVEMQVDSMFSGEEDDGQYFDLYPLHEKYSNLTGRPRGRHLTYNQYLDVFDDFQGPAYRMDTKHKLSNGYFDYVTALGEYLESFMRRTRPLETLDKIIASIDADFGIVWKQGDVAGWQKKSEAPETDNNHSEINGSGEEFWCDDCVKKFNNENTFQAHFDGKKHIKNAKERAEKGETKPTSSAVREMASLAADLKPRAVAEREFRVKKLANMMQTVRHDTKANLERRAGMTEKEREADREARMAAKINHGPDVAEAPEQDDDDEIYNPLKLPMNWDGRPIPYWLYKLHGLGVEYPCQICGDFVYHGRRAFEKHFTEARHTYGLRCLGITPSTMFREITSIEEAQELNEKLRKDKEVTSAKHKDVEEMEDSYGNVMPRKVFEDLQAAGLV